VKKSSAERATEGRPAQKARGIKDTALRDTRKVSLWAVGRLFWACLSGLAGLTPSRVGVRFPARPVFSIGFILAK
jgi:hypothetical protein